MNCKNSTECVLRFPLVLTFHCDLCVTMFFVLELPHLTVSSTVKYDA